MGTRTPLAAAENCLQTEDERTRRAGSGAGLVGSQETVLLMWAIRRVYPAHLNPRLEGGQRLPSESLQTCWGFASL